MLRNAAILTLALALAGPVWAQTKATPAQSATNDAPTRIAVINIQTAIAATDEGKQASQELQVKFAPRQTQLNNLSKQVQDIQQRLQDGQNTLSSAEKSRLNLEYQEDSRNYQREQQELQQDAQDAETDAMDSIGEKMMPIVNQYAAQHHYSIVLDTSQSNTVLYAANSVDITSAIVKLYNQQHPVKAASTAPSTAPKP
jgi:outer membrane protein